MSLNKILQDFIQEKYEEYKKNFHKVFGHYSNATGSMFFEMYHGGEGLVIFKRGEHGKPLIDDRVITIDEAIEHFHGLSSLGYSQVFKGVTQDDMDRGNQKRIQSLSSAQRENILGRYYKGKHYFEIQQFGENFSVMRGYDDMISSGEHDLTETIAVTKLNAAIDDGYAKLEERKLDWNEFRDEDW